LEEWVIDLLGQDFMFLQYARVENPSKILAKELLAIDLQAVGKH
jgi:hypothetical protein